MYKILIFSFCVSISFLNCSSVLQSPLFSSESTPQGHFSALRTNCCSPVCEIRTSGRSQSQSNMLTDKELERIELDKARQNKEYYDLPTPASFGILETDTPVDKSSLIYTEEWLKNFNNRETRLFQDEDNERLQLEKEYDFLIRAIKNDEFFKRLAINFKKSEK